MYLKTLVNTTLLNNLKTTNRINATPVLHTSFRKHDNTYNIVAKYTEKDITQFGRSYYKIQTLLANTHIQSKQSR